MKGDSESIGKEILGDFARAWRRLIVSDVAYKVAGFVILAPLSAVLLQLFIRLSGQTALSDEDILFFLLRPIGWVALIVVGAIVIGIVAMELVTLMLIGFGAAEDRDVGVLSALVATFRRGPSVLLLTGRMMGLILLISAPFLLVVAGLYLFLLTEHDINFYLTFKPPEFWTAVVLAGLVLGSLLIVILRLVSGWLYALPLMLFESVPARKALKESSVRTSGHRWWIARWILAWLVFGLVLEAVVTGPIGLLGRLLVPRVAGTLTLLVPVLGMLALLWGLANLIVNVLAASSFGLLLVRLYRARGDRGAARLAVAATEPRVEGTSVSGLTGGRVLWGMVAAVVIAAIVGGVTLSRVRLEDDTTITAHRGASGAAPENTMAAVERAIEDGADWVEIDVQETADGVVVVAHDSDFMKVSNLSTRIWDAIYHEDLVELDIGSWFGPEFGDQGVPTLAEVLDVCNDKVGVNIELKYYGHDVRLEERVVELVEERDMADQVVVMSLKLAGVEKIQALRPDWTVGLLAAVAVGDLTRVDVDFLAVSTNLATPFLIRSAHKSGKQVYVWTVNDIVGMSTQFSRGADSLITDEPALARAALAYRAELSPVERLLVELATLFGVRSERVLTEADA